MSVNGTVKIYLLAVCFISLACAALSFGIGIYSLIKVVKPELTLDAQLYQAHSSLAAFKNSHYFRFQSNPRAFLAPHNSGLAIPIPLPGVQSGWHIDNGESEPELSDHEMEQLRIESYNSALKVHGRNATQTLIRVSIAFLVSLLLFFLHWGPAKKSDRTPGK